MPYVDAHLFSKKGVKKQLTLILEDDDGIEESIKAGMKEHKLNSVTIESVDGSVKEAIINYFEGNSFRSSTIKDKAVMIASGSYKLSYDELFGTMKIVTNEKPPMHGTLVRGKAKDGLTIRLSFVDIVDGE
ncbi:MAG: hypothetical protein NUV67_06385 [archaeon]|nr:hypothetical protein [archaeon]